MTREETIKWLESLKAEIGKSGNRTLWHYAEAIDMAIEALSEEPPYQYSKAYVEQIRGERDILQDMVDNMAKPKTEMVLCALADRVCPFQGREFAWCLTCPHISEEDRELVKKAVAEPKTGEWLEVEVFPEVYDIEGVKSWGSKMQCDQCGFRFTAIEGHITQYNYCPNCGARMTKGGDDK